MMYKIVKKNEQKYNWHLYLMVCITLFLTTASFGQVCLWLTGSCNYLWGAGFYLTVIYIYKEYACTTRDEPNLSIINVLVSIPIFVLCFIAGGFNENISPAILVIVIMIMKHKEFTSNPLWIYMGVLGMVLGSLFLIFAPGNFERSNAVNGTASFIVTYASRFAILSFRFSKILPIVLATLFFCRIKSINNKNRVDYLPIILIIAAVLSNIAMIMVNAYPERAMFGGTLLAVVALLYCIVRVDYHDNISKNIIYMGVVCACVINIIFASFDIIATKKCLIDEKKFLYKMKDLKIHYMSIASSQ